MQSAVFSTNILKYDPQPSRNVELFHEKMPENHFFGKQI